MDFIKASNIKHSCFTTDFDKVFKEENNFRLGETSDFSEIFNCISWNEIIIGGGTRNPYINSIVNGNYLPALIKKDENK